MDVVENYDIYRKRVFFENVLLVTYHQKYGIAFVVTMGIFFILFAAIAFLFFSKLNNIGAVIFALVALCFFIPLILRLIYRLDIITVYGNRSCAKICYLFNKAKAKSAFSQICYRVQKTQKQMADEMAEREAQIYTAPPLEKHEN